MTAPLRSGFTTGACAAAAAKAAAMVLAGHRADLHEVDVPFPNGTRASIPIAWTKRHEDRTEAAVRKDAGDDPDITHGSLVVAAVAWGADAEVSFVAGDGVGTVTKPGLSVPVGEPAINPVPRRMIRDAVREVTPRGVTVTVSIPGGRELAAKTFNPRLGVEGGLSILGTTGIVRPFSCDAVRATIEYALRVARAAEVRRPVLVPGHIGERAARRHYRLGPEQVIEVANEWGVALDLVAAQTLEGLLVAGHPGKLAKLTAGEWQTHSAQSGSAVPVVAALARELGLSEPSSETASVDGLFAAYSPPERRRLGDSLAEHVGRAIALRLGSPFAIAVCLVNMQGEILGTSGDLTPWL